jgi:hypothetical protein
MYKLYNIGERTERCGTPACISLGVDNSPSTETLNFMLERNGLISLIVLAESINLINLYSKPGCQVVSEAFSICKNTAAIERLLLKLKVT